MNVADKRVSNTNSTPPRAPLAFRVGVVGHRPDRLDSSKLEELSATIRTILSTVKAETLAVAEQLTEIYDGARPVLRALSPLAEGTDRILAEQALAPVSGALCCLAIPSIRVRKGFCPGPRAGTRILEPFPRVIGAGDHAFRARRNA